MAKARRQTRKRANGDGSVFQLPDGSWRAVVSCGTIGGKRIRRTRKAATRDAAKQALADLQREVGGALPASTEITVAEWLNEWIESAKTGKAAENTIESYRYSVTNHIVPHLGACKLASLTTAHVDAAFRRMKAGDRTRELAFQTLSASLRRAVKKGLIASNPCLDADKPKVVQKKIVPMDPDDVRKILAEVKDDRLYGVFVLAFSLGMRQGELFGLRWADVSFENRTITIHQQACEVAGHIVVRKPKTESGSRTIQVSENVINVLRTRRADSLREGHAAAELVFVNERGGPVRRSNFAFRHWKPTLKKLGIKHRGFHIARHTAASLMLGAGIPVHVVSQILGHSKPSVTLNLYSHLMKHQSDAAAKIIDSMIG